ncbi:hypothetical protein HY024_02085 [Candidatus Curtissbacteria bacterium]|nr:hypothetical protein [Candidatus Curtissbacteria bacterium]
MYKSKKGATLIEVLIAIGLMAMFLPALITGVAASKSGKAQQIQRLEAVQLMKEGVTAAEAVRTADWVNVSTNGVYHPQIITVSGSQKWSLPAGGETIHGFNRTITISDLYRTGNQISNSGTLLDPSIKKADVTISWSTPFSSSVSTTVYLSRYFNNNFFTDTTVNDFGKTGSIFTSTEAVSPSGNNGSSDGKVILKNVPAGGDWCQPQKSVIATYDLTHSGVPISISAVSLSSQDLAYTTTGNNASGDSLDKISISHATPPVVTNPNAITGPKAYGVFTDGTYLYFNENNSPNHTVQIANANDLSLLGFFDVKNSTGTSIFVSGNTGFTTVGNTLYSFDVSSKTGARPLLGSVGLAGTGNKVVVVGTHAYVATSSNNKQLQVVNVSNPASMSVSGTINLGNNQGAVDLFVDSSEKYAYLITSFTSGKNDFFIVDLANTSNIYGYQAINSMSPKGIIVPTGNRAIIVGSGGEQYQVFDISSASSARHCGGMSPAGVSSINAVSGVTQASGNVFSYIITDNASAEFQIVQGGPGGAGGYPSSGTYESSTFGNPNATNPLSTAFNRVDLTYIKPSGTDLQFQLGVADAVSGSCSGVTYSFVGPDKTSGTYFLTGAPTLTPISVSYPTPFGTNPSGYQNPGKCFRYRGYLTTSSSASTPVINDVTINYSP